MIVFLGMPGMAAFAVRAGPFLFVCLFPKNGCPPFRVLAVSDGSECFSDKTLFSNLLFSRRRGLFLSLEHPSSGPRAASFPPVSGKDSVVAYPPFRSRTLLRGVGRGAWNDMFFHAFWQI